MRRVTIATTSLVLFLAATWLAGGGSRQQSSAESWHLVAPGVLRSAGLPCGYALVDGEHAFLIGAPRGANLAALKERGVKHISTCLLTHHHRDTSASAALFVKEGIKVRAPAASAEWLGPEGVRQFWATSLPLLPPGKVPVLRDRTFGVFAYLVHAAGVSGVDFDLNDNDLLEWRGWKIQALATPGHSRDHMAFAAWQPKAAGDRQTAPIVFCGDAFLQPGKLWSPYTTDWDHWQGLGLEAAASSLRKLAALNPAPALLCPEHGAPFVGDTAAALNETARNATDAAFLKNFERFTKERLGNAPAYPFLAKEQVATAGEKPWSQLSEHLFLTGNTFALTSRDGPVLVIDPFGPGISEQIRTLQKDRGLGPVEVVLISHAHNDHYTGVFQLPERNRLEVWTLDMVARAVSDPFFYYAPYVDSRPLVPDRELKAGETVKWREYAFRIQHLPGQTHFTMGIETVIDGKKCYLTADNFFHADQFSGSGGWSGRNRSWPGVYADSAQAVLSAKPDWVLAEHGGAFEFNAEDFRRRVRWGRDAAAAADALSPTGNHRSDWNPTRITVEPLMQRSTPGGKIKSTLVVNNLLPRSRKLIMELDHRGLLPELRQTINVEAGATLRHAFELETARAMPPGRHVFPVSIREGDVEDGTDVFLIVEVTPTGAGGQ